MTKATKLCIMLGMFVMLLGSTAFAASKDLKVYDARFDRAYGFLTLEIDEKGKKCEGSIKYITDQSGNEMTFETKMAKCIIDKYAKNSKGKTTALQVQFTKAKNDDTVYYGWVSVNKPGLEYKMISGYYLLKGTSQSLPWFATEIEE